jgi:hypothetical protein
MEKDAVGELEQWAKDNGHDSAQKMIDDYYDGNIYDALDADNYFLDAHREARDAGFKGVRINFGDLKDRMGGSKQPVGDVIILNDHSAATKVAGGNPPPT